MFYSVKMDMASIQFEELTILWAKKMSQIKVYSFSFKNMAIKSLKLWVCVCECVCSAVHSCPTLCDPTDCSPSEYVWASLGKNTGMIAISSSRGFARPRDWTQFPASLALAGGFFTPEPPGNIKYVYAHVYWCWFSLSYGRNQHNIAKQASFYLEKEYKCSFIGNVWVGNSPQIWVTFAIVDICLWRGLLG